MEKDKCDRCRQETDVLYFENGLWLCWDEVRDDEDEE